MKRRRKIVVCIAMSTDGFVARPDGDVAWLERPGQKGDYGLAEFFKTIDTILWGRKTYDKGIEMGMKSSDFGPRVKHYLFLAVRGSHCCRDSSVRARRSRPSRNGCARSLAKIYG